MKYKFEKASKHIADDHMDRAVYLLTEIGVGKVVAKFPMHNEKGPTLHCITDTGLLLIKTPDEKKIITLFNCTPERCCAYFKEKGQIPPQYLMNTCKKLEKKIKKIGVK